MMNTEQWQQVAELAITILLPVVLAFLARTWREKLKRQEREGVWDQLEWIVRLAVRAVEQLDIAEELAEFGETKLAAALKLIEAQCWARGIDIDLEQYGDAIRVMIEGEVATLPPMRRRPSGTSGIGSGQ